MRISRRAFLATGGGVLGAVAIGGAAGAALGTLRPAQPAPFAAPAAPPALARAVQREEALLSACSAAAARFPELADRLAPIIADHTAHFDAAAREWARITEATAVPSAVPSGSPGAADGTAAATAADALALLRAQESAAADAAAADCLDAPGDDESGRRLAVLLGSISACETVHIGWLA